MCEPYSFKKSDRFPTFTAKKTENGWDFGTAQFITKNDRFIMTARLTLSYPKTNRFPLLYGTVNTFLNAKR